MKIKHSELKQVFTMLMDLLPKNESDEIELHYDYYWNLPVGTRHDICETPELDIGSINHDLERIRECLEDNAPMPHHFRYLGNILISISDSMQAQSLIPY